MRVRIKVDNFSDLPTTAMQCEKLRQQPNIVSPRYQFYMYTIPNSSPTLQSSSWPCFCSLLGLSLVPVYDSPMFQCGARTPSLCVAQPPGSCTSLALHLHCPFTHLSMMILSFPSQLKGLLPGVALTDNPKALYLHKGKPSHVCRFFHVSCLFFGGFFHLCVCVCTF